MEENNQEVYNYYKRIKQLIPYQLYPFKETNPKNWISKQIKMIKINIDTVYWYSISMVNKEFPIIENNELIHICFDKEIFRYKYVFLAKIEMCYMILLYVKKNLNKLCIDDNQLISMIKYVINLIDIKKNYFSSNFLEYERKRLFFIKEQTRKFSSQLIIFEKQLQSIFLSIFYKSNLSKNYYFCHDLIFEIYSYIK